MGDNALFLMLALRKSTRLAYMSEKDSARQPPYRRGVHGIGPRHIGLRFTRRELRQGFNMPVKTIAPSENAADRMKHFNEKCRSPKILSKSSRVPSGSAPTCRTSNVSSHFERASLARWDASFSLSSKTPRTEPATTTGTLLVPKS
jgi:hypothetical protein